MYLYSSSPSWRIQTRQFINLATYSATNNSTETLLLLIVLLLLLIIVLVISAPAKVDSATFDEVNSPTDSSHNATLPDANDTT